MATTVQTTTISNASGRHHANQVSIAVSRGLSTRLATYADAGWGAGVNRQKSRPIEKCSRFSPSSPKL